MPKKVEENKKYKCKLCNKEYEYEDMSDEHYPAKSVGNDDIGNFDLVKFFDLMESQQLRQEIKKEVEKGEKFRNISDNIFDNYLFTSTHPKGRTARTLCRNCNTFLGKYDEAYLRFFKADGNPKIVKGFQRQTKYQIIKSIYAKFLSVPETENENFDFIEFIRDESILEYNGCWKLYFIKRNYTSDLLGFKNIETGKLDFEEGIVYEFSDEKFIYNLINFKIHSCYRMTNIFDILNKDYVLIEGVDDSGGYHGQLMLQRLFSSLEDN